MNDSATTLRTNWRTIAASTIVALAGLCAATTAFAHDDDDYGRGKKHHGRYFVPPGHVYYAPPVYYAPRPVRVYAPPAYYYEPVPVYSPPPGININIPLR